MSTITIFLLTVACAGVVWWLLLSIEKTINKSKKKKEKIHAPVKPALPLQVITVLKASGMVVRRLFLDLEQLVVDEIDKMLSTGKVSKYSFKYEKSRGDIKIWIPRKLIPEPPKTNDEGVIELGRTCDTNELIVELCDIYQRGWSHFVALPEDAVRITNIAERIVNKISMFNETKKNINLTVKANSLLEYLKKIETHNKQIKC